MQYLVLRAKEERALRIKKSLSEGLDCSAAFAVSAAATPAVWAGVGAKQAGDSARSAAASAVPAATAFPAECHFHHPPVMSDWVPATKSSMIGAPFSA